MFDDYTTEQLEEELKRRNKIEQELSKPIIVDNPQFGSLKKLCSDYIEQASLGDVDDDMSEYIFEEAMKCLFGRDVFEWINDRS